MEAQAARAAHPTVAVAIALARLQTAGPIVILSYEKWAVSGAHWGGQTSDVLELPPPLLDAAPPAQPHDLSSKAVPIPPAVAVAPATRNATRQAPSVRAAHTATVEMAMSAGPTEA